MTTPAAGRRALLIVDVQNDFCPGGALGTERGDAVAGAIATYVAQHRGDYDEVLTTQDWHIDPEGHFSEEPDFVDTWPVHCVADSPGAQLHPVLRSELAARPADAAFFKGEYTAAYSAAEAATAEGDNQTGFLDYLDAHNITSVDAVGIATDHCVRASVLDILATDRTVRVLTDMCSPVSDEAAAAALEEMRAAGAEVV